jgi:hypothetical protein
MQGSTRASRVVTGAPAGHIFESHTFPIIREDATGKGADGDMRGACAPRAEAVLSLRAD